MKALHIVSRDGKINQDTRRKLKQVYHLVQFLRELLPQQTNPDPLIVDLGSGKSYLGFLLYDLWFSRLKTGKIWSIEARQDLIETCRQLARESGFERMYFSALSIQATLRPDFVLPEELKLHCPRIDSVDLVTALHACDTATDEAILFSLKWKAKNIALVPCCQAQVAAQLKDLDLSSDSLSALFTAPIHAREFGSHLTNVLRVLFLRGQGYKVTVTELIGWEHSMKNELILAKWTGKKDPIAQKQYADLTSRFGVRLLLD